MEHIKTDIAHRYLCLEESVKQLLNNPFIQEHHLRAVLKSLEVAQIVTLGNEYFNFKRKNDGSQEAE
jgi:hypothetical protein